MADALPPKNTGLVCPACKQPVALIEHHTPNTITMRCPACAIAGPGARQGRSHIRISS